MPKRQKEPEPNSFTHGQNRDRIVQLEKTIEILKARVKTYQESPKSGTNFLDRYTSLQEVVDSKTRELEIQKQKLSEAIEQLRRSQADILQMQKLESIGLLATGIAHEINTPIQFVSDSVHFVSDSTRGLLKIVHELRDANLACQSREPLADTIFEDFDLDYVTEMLPVALDRALEGLDRVAELVRSLKTYAHPDTKEMSTIDLNHAIASTLTIARNEYKYDAELIVEYGELPPVTCFVGEVNQGILNIVVNAAHAIQEVRDSHSPLGIITVRTYRSKDNAIIEISDSGCGIPQEIIGKIFDPFFTTKEVGRGTGQGLTQVHSIFVRKLGGSVQVASVVGQGTTFRISIPIEGASGEHSEIAA
ncbi:MAG: ATP-binding protein [Armatimonadetes bacterium]|nr:ATP-binding protein [Armatimonadota bacterium]